METTLERRLPIPDFTWIGALLALMLSPILLVSYRNDATLKVLSYLPQNLVLYGAFALLGVVSSVVIAIKCNENRFEKFGFNVVFFRGYPFLVAFMTGLFFAMHMFLAKENLQRLEIVYTVMYYYSIFLVLVALFNYFFDAAWMSKPVIAMVEKRRNQETFEVNTAVKLVGSIPIPFTVLSAFVFYGWISTFITPLHNTFLFGLFPLLTFLFTTITVVLALMLIFLTRFSFLKTTIFIFNGKVFFRIATWSIATIVTLFSINYLVLYLSV